MKRIGILGGTFDPIHNGHLLLAKEAAKQAKLNQVMFMPAKLQPFKLDQQVTDAKHRLAMIKLAIEQIEGFAVSTYELDSPAVSYTCNTLQAMAQAYPEDRLYFITGTDAFLKIGIWKNADEMLTSYGFIVGKRPGYRDAELKQKIEQFKRDYHTDMIQVESPMLHISSTEIREGAGKECATKGHIFKEGGLKVDGIKEQIPPSVERYIRDHDLY